MVSVGTVIRRVSIYLLLVVGAPSFASTSKYRPSILCPNLLRSNHEPVFQLHLEDEYIGLNVRYPPIEALRKTVEKKIRKELLNRGEAHITVLTPPEYRVLTKVLTPEGLLAIANQVGGHHSQIKPICIGKGEAMIDEKKEQTYFVVVRVPVLLRIRFAIYTAFVAAGGKPQDFQPGHFFPHITLGFTKHDLYEQDGVIKNSDSCLYPLVQK